MPRDLLLENHTSIRCPVISPNLFTPSPLGPSTATETASWGHNSPDSEVDFLTKQTHCLLMEATKPSPSAHRPCLVCASSQG